jgi:hypothetical protein
MTNNEYFNHNPDGSICTSWIQHPVTGKLIPRTRYERPDTRAHMIMKPLEPFVSTIDGRHISCRSHLRAHNAENGVTNHADYSDGYIERKARAKHMAQAKLGKADRIDTIQRAMHNYS